MRDLPGNIPTGNVEQTVRFFELLTRLEERYGISPTPMIGRPPGWQMTFPEFGLTLFPQVCQGIVRRRLEDPVFSTNPPWQIDAIKGWTYRLTEVLYHRIDLWLAAAPSWPVSEPPF